MGGSYYDMTTLGGVHATRNALTRSEFIEKWLSDQSYTLLKNSSQALDLVHSH